MECSSSTGACQNFVQPANPSLTDSNFRHYFRGFDETEISAAREGEPQLDCGNQAKTLSGAAFRRSQFSLADACELSANTGTVPTYDIGKPPS